MLSAILGLVSAFILGSADFLGGVASKGMSALRITAIVAVSGLVPLLIMVAVTNPIWSWQAMFYGGLSGVSGAIAISLLYACLAVGPMSILSPTTAVVAAVVPMTVGLVQGHQLAIIGYFGLGLALVAVVLVGFVPERGAVRPSARGMAMAVGSGVMIGVFLILIDLTPDDSGVVPLVMNRAVNAAIMSIVIGVLALVVVRRRSLGGAGGPAGLAGLAGPDSAERVLRESGDESTYSAGASHVVSAGFASAAVVDAADLPVELDVAGSGSATLGAPSLWWRGPIGIAIVAGFVDAIANIVLLIGLRLGELTVISVLSAMYPAGTIILAAVVLRERIAPVQIVGLVLAIAAAGMLAIA